MLVAEAKASFLTKIFIPLRFRKNFLTLVTCFLPTHGANGRRECGIQNTEWQILFVRLFSFEAIRSESEDEQAVIAPDCKACRKRKQVKQKNTYFLYKKRPVLAVFCYDNFHEEANNYKLELIACLANLARSIISRLTILASRPYFKRESSFR